MHTQRLRYFWLALFCLVVALPATAQKKKKDDPKKGDAPAATGQSPTPPDTSKPKGPFKPYADVVTAKVVTDSGVFAVHKLEEQYLYEIPNELLGREFLLVVRYAALQRSEGNYAGEQIIGENIVRWERRDKQIMLRLVSYTDVADSTQPIYKAVKSSSLEPIIATFDIKTMPEDSSAVVIDATPLYTSDVPLLGLPKEVRQAYVVILLDNKRSYISEHRSFPTNLFVKNVLTYKANNPPSDAETGTYTAEIAISMLLLPEKPARRRLADWRVGYFALGKNDFGDGASPTKNQYYTKRWRLEPKDPAAYLRGELVEPVNPIVYYIDPATPAQWRPYLKQGIEDWQAAFERAGFKNAIIAKDPPSPEEDPEWSPEDARYSVIRYFASPIQNAYGPSLADPRSGEIIESDIGWYHNVMELLRNWFFIQTSPYNPDAQKIKFDDKVMGELIRFVSAHEVGHTLGLPHNMGSSNAVPVDSLRSASYTQKHGICPSIMDYARFNYVRQPGDDPNVAVMPRVGEYDKWAIEWGYRWFPESMSEEQVAEELRKMTLAKAGNPVYFFGRQQVFFNVDPRSLTEQIGDDAMLASDYGIRNLKRIVENLPDWSEDPGNIYDEMQTLFLNVLGQWNRYAGHVTANIGGVYENFKTWEQEGAVYTPVETAKQKRAMAFLQKEYFATPNWLLAKGLLEKFQRPGTLNWLGDFQQNVLGDVLRPDRLQRLSEAEALYGSNAYSLEECLTDLRTGLFTEATNLAEPDFYRRALQRAYVDRLGSLMTSTGGINVSASSPTFSAVGTPIDFHRSEILPTVRGELTALRTVLARAAAYSRSTRAKNHYSDLLVRVEDILDGED